MIGTARSALVLSLFQLLGSPDAANVLVTRTAHHKNEKVWGLSGESSLRWPDVGALKAVLSLDILSLRTAYEQRFYGPKREVSLQTPRQI